MNTTEALELQRSRDICLRIADYLSLGGLFNPELANHLVVRDLLIESRECFSKLAEFD